MMSDNRKDIEALAQTAQAAANQIGLKDLEASLLHLNEQIAQPDFWQDASRAADIMKEHSKLHARLSPWQELQRKIKDVSELAQLDDPALESELSQHILDITRDLDKLKQDLKFNGQYDDHDAILSIHAGAGGTDAQDWTAMLLRMYMRWAEQHGYKIETIDQSMGDEAGIKSITLEISGNFVYGKLKGEQGVHRLVRLSPFNADNLRQTSFAKVEVMPRINKPAEIEIDEKDLRVDVYRSGGKGGQSVNTTDSAVRITHIPTGITIAIQNERSQLQNRETALTILRSRLAQLQLEQHAKHVADLKGPNQSAEWGSQIRSYVLHPYTMVKDLRTRHETTDAEAVLNGDIDGFIEAYLETTLTA